MQPGYTPRDVVKLTGVPYSTLNLWAKTNFIRPSVQQANGTGTERIYSQSDLFELRIAKVLRDQGLSLYITQLAMKRLRDYPKAKRVEIQICRQPDIYISIQRPA